MLVYGISFLKCIKYRLHFILEEQRLLIHLKCSRGLRGSVLGCTFSVSTADDSVGYVFFYFIAHFEEQRCDSVVRRSFGKVRRVMASGDL